MLWWVELGPIMTGEGAEASSVVGRVDGYGSAQLSWGLPMLYDRFEF